MDRDVNELADIAKEEPQAALCAYNMGLSQRWTFVQRTIKDISFLFEPLEEAIRNILIPAICGKVVSDIERKLISLPYKYGGLGIRNPVETCKDQFDQSLAITSELTQMICQQDLDLSKLNKSAIKEKKKEVVSLKEKKLKESLDALIEAFDEKTKRLGVIPTRIDNYCTHSHQIFSSLDQMVPTMAGTKLPSFSIS